MADLTKIMQLFADVRAELELEEPEPTTLEKIKEGKTAQTALQLIDTYKNVNAQPMPKTYEDFAKIVKIQAQAPPAYEPKMGTPEYVAKSVYSKLVEKPIYALGEGAAAALEAGARTVGLKGIADYFKGSKEMWKTPPTTQDVDEQFAWLLESARKQSPMHGMVVEMAEIGAQIGSLLIQMGLLGKVPGIKAIDTTMFAGTAALPQVGKQMAAMFAHGVATTPGDLSNRFTAGITRMAYNMTPYIANWTGATGWGARTVDTALNAFLTSPTYIKNVKTAKNPMEFIMSSLPQFMTDFIFALNTTGTPMNQRLKAMGARPVVFGQKMEEKEAFLRGVDKALAETERPYGEEAPEPTEKQAMDKATGEARVESTKEDVLRVYRGERPRKLGALFATDAGDLGAGVYYTDYKPTAKAYGAGRYKATELKFENPLRLSAKEAVELSEKYGTVSGRTEAERLAGARKMSADLMAKGYDGLVVEGYDTPKGYHTFVELKTTELAVSKISPKRITAGEFPGIMITKTEYKKQLAQAKKAAADARMDGLIDPITKGRKLSNEQQLLVASESKNIWEKLGYGWGILHLGNMRPERMMEELDGFRRGPNTEVGYTKISEAMDTRMQGITNGTESLKNVLTKLGIMTGINDFYARREYVGARMQLTKTEMVDIYMDMQNPKGVNHLTKSKAQNGMGFTKADLAEVSARVEADPQMKGLANWMFKAYETWYPIVASIYFKETGKVLPKEPYYSPLRVMKEFLDFESDNYAQDLFNRYHIDGYVEKGFTKERQAGASQPIKLDAIGNYLYNLNRIEHYINLALPLKDFRGVMNDPRWRNAVTTTKGETFYQNVKKYYDAVAGTKPSGADEMANKVMGFLRTNAGTAMLGFNLLTATRQPLSIFQATAEVGLPHVLSAMRQLILDPKGLESFIYERSKQVALRQGQFERFMTETEVSLPELLGKPKAPKAVTGKPTIRDRAMALAVFLDKNTVLATWKAAYDKVTMTGKTLDGEKIPTRDLEKAARMEADLAVRRTQPMATVKDLPAWHRSASFLKLFTMFQNQINNNYNYFAHDIIGKARAGKITPWEAAQKTLFAYILPAMALGMIARGGLPKNNKQVAEDMLTYPLSGLFFVGGMINNAIKEYSDWGIPPLQFAPDLIKTYTSKEWSTKARYGLKGIAELTGIPYNQLYRTWQGMQALLDGKTDDWRRLIWSEYTLTKGLPKQTEKGGLKVFKRKEI